MIKVYNSISNKKEIFKPRKGKRVNMFVCGITPYDSAHIGNFRVFINYDIIARYLRFRDYTVFYLQNITDIDDKIIAAAKEKNVSANAIAEHYFKEFLGITRQLNIKSVSKYAKATKYIKQIIRQIETLIKKGYAYEHNGSVYFEVKKFKRYGKLSRQNLAKLHTSVRLEEDLNKKHPYDFVLWKAKREGEPFWKSPWGEGRPGWHIEDTAISESFFGPQYDIHGGAVELKFPHHEAEIAQQESASGKHPMVKYWVHAGILKIHGEKMSKSLGNFITGKEMVQKYAPDYFRFMIASVHYRSPIDYSEKLIAQARANLDRLRDFSAVLRTIKQKDGKPFDIIPYRKKFLTCLDDDFNAPSALAEIFTLVRDGNIRIASGTLTQKDARNIIDFFKDIERIFGVPLRSAQTHKIPEDVLKLAQERDEQRKVKHWENADILRARMQTMGYDVKDLKEGFEITKIKT